MLVEIDKASRDYIARCYDAIGPVVIPVVDRISPLVQADPRFRVGLMSSGAYAEPPIFRAGVSAERLNYPISHVSLSFGCVVVSFPGQKEPSLTISVGWHRAFFQNQHAGFSVYESRLSSPIQTIDEAVRLVKQHLPACEQRTREALRRATIPGKFTHWLHQIIRRVPPAEIWPPQGGRIRGLPDVRTFVATHDVQTSPKAS